MIGTITIRKLKYTAILTSFNAERTLARAIKGILDQKIPASQIVIIDDCSSDNSVQIAKEFALKDNRISVIENQRNQGQSLGRNLGATLSESDFVIFFDDDDLSSPQRSVAHYEMLENQAVVSYVSSQIHYPNGYSKLATNSDFNGQLQNENALRALLLGPDKNSNDRFFVPASTLAVDLETFKKIGGFDQTLRRLEDVDLAIRLVIENQIIAFSSENLVSRYSTTSADKGGGIDMVYEEILLKKYRAYFSNSEFKFALTHCKTRKLYFSKKYVSLIVHFLVNPAYVLRIILNPRRALSRLVHDFKKRTIS